jgi:two-component system, chemotaxis family, chemotaxis protein CheY
MTKASNILIVDDDEATLASLGGLLELEGYSVEKARNGREALDTLGTATEAPGLILLDLNMPVMDGWQFLTERAKDAVARAAPVVLLSGLPYIPNAEGVADFLTKPVNAARLLACVRRFCGDPNGEISRTARPEPSP